MHSTQTRTPGSLESQKYVINEITIRTWTDEQFAAVWQTDRTAAAKLIAKSCDVSLDELGIDVNALVIPQSPIGEVETLPKIEASGTWPTLTADCGCQDTTTGGCSCYSIWGTPCLTCQ